MKIHTLKWNKKIGLAAVAFGLVLSISVGSAFAYFVANTDAVGSQTVELGSQTTITEDPDGLNKMVYVTNNGTEDAYVRVIVNSDTEGVTAEWDKAQSEGWNKDNNIYYYTEVLPAGETTSQLYISVVPDESVTHDFEVIVVQESTAANFADASGSLAANNADYTGWSLLADDAIGYGEGE